MALIFTSKVMMKKLALCLCCLWTCLSYSQAKAEGLAVFADVLPWHASQEASSTWATTIVGAPRLLDFDATNIDFGWNTGFRGGFSYIQDDTCWDTKISWTYYPTKASTGFAIGDQIVLPQFFSGFLSGNFFFGADINWKINMNMVDFELGRKIDLNDRFAIRPSIGIKAGTINQTINCQWKAGVFTATERVTHNYSALGPSFGLDSQWNLCNSFSIFGDFSTAFMWGNWKIKDTYSRPAALGGLVTPTTITTSMNNSKLGTLMFRYRLGLQWIAPTKFPVTFQLGYEMQFWPNQLRLPTFQQLPVHGGLTLQGGTCQVRIDI